LNCTLEFKYNTTCDECYKCFANFDKCSTGDTCNEIKTNIDSLSYDKIGVIEFKPRLNGFPKIQKGLIDSTFKKFFEIEIILDTHGNRKLTKNIPSFLNNFKSESFLKLILKTCEIDEKSKNIINELRQFESLIIARSLFENYTLPQEFLKSQTKLNRLELSYNNLKFLPTHVFSDLRDLRDLLLQNNQLSSLPSDIFKMNVNLKRLDLKRNQIKKLPVDIFSTLKLLRTLSLDGNQIEILPEKLFNNNLKLEKFWIVGNKLKQISFEFSSLPELSILDIRQNKCCDCRADSKENFPKILNLIKTKC
jgi:Leucine-rich repeat (LRR) protein